MDERLVGLRRDYTSAELDVADVFADPMIQFHKWFDEALLADVLDVEAMVLSTATAAGVPSGRVVLLRQATERGFVFYTNYASAKGADLECNPHCSLTFHWRELERQVRISGVASHVPVTESAVYFASRPRGSQLGAWASAQSTVLRSRSELEERWDALEKEYAGREVPLPEFWGGYVVKPVEIEFWQGRRSRLHDRVRYRLDDVRWVIERLAP